MILLVIIFLIFVSTICIYRINTLIIRKKIFIGLYGILGLIIGLRDTNTGVDTIAYFDNYNQISQVDYTTAFVITAMEPGYVALNKLAYELGFEYYTFQLLFSIIMFILFGNFIFKNTKDIVTATIIFLGAGYFACSINIMRQMMAIAICANSWSYICQKKYIKAALIIVIASLFHATVLLYIFPLFLYLMRNNKLIIYGFTYAVICMGGMLPFIFNLLQQYNLYDSYTDLDNTGQTGGLVRIVWIIEIIFIFYLLLNKKIGIQQKIISNLAFFSVVMAMLDEKVRYLDRVGLVFFPFVVLLFCVVGDSIRNKKMKEQYFIICNLFFFLFFCYRGSDFIEFSTFL